MLQEQSKKGDLQKIIDGGAGRGKESHLIIQYDSNIDEAT